MSHEDDEAAARFLADALRERETQFRASLGPYGRSACDVYTRMRAEFIQLVDTLLTASDADTTNEAANRIRHFHMEILSAGLRLMRTARIEFETRNSPATCPDPQTGDDTQCLK